MRSWQRYKRNQECSLYLMFTSYVVYFPLFRTDLGSCGKTTAAHRGERLAARGHDRMGACSKLVNPYADMVFLSCFSTFSFQPTSSVGVIFHGVFAVYSKYPLIQSQSHDIVLILCLFLILWRESFDMTCHKCCICQQGQEQQGPRR